MIDRWLICAAFLFVLIAAACAGGGGTAPGTSATASSPPPRPSPPSPSIDSSTGSPTTASPTSSAAGPSASTAPAAAVLNEPWATATVTDVTTGTPFRIADLAATGKVVFVEPMAIWCTNCRAQQEAAVEALAGLDPDRVEWVGVDVESSETPEALAQYSQQYGFPFRYVIADQALARALADRFGDVVLSPPSVNIIVVGTDGRVTHLTGHRRPEEIADIAAEHGA